MVLVLFITILNPRFVNAQIQFSVDDLPFSKDMVRINWVANPNAKLEFDRIVKEFSDSIVNSYNKMTEFMFGKGIKIKVYSVNYDPQATVKDKLVVEDHYDNPTQNLLL
jgi:hypothetical protein